MSIDGPIDGAADAGYEECLVTAWYSPEQYNALREELAAAHAMIARYPEHRDQDAAAREILRLRAENARLREEGKALRLIVIASWSHNADVESSMRSLGLIEPGEDDLPDVGKYVVKSRLGWRLSALGRAALSGEAAPEGV